MYHVCVWSSGCTVWIQTVFKLSPKWKMWYINVFPPTTVCLKTGILWHLLICDSPLYIFFQSGSCQIIRFWIWLLKSSTLLVHKLHYSDSKQFKIRVKCHINKKLKTECRTTQWCAGQHNDIHCHNTSTAQISTLSGCKCGTKRTENLRIRCGVYIVCRVFEVEVSYEVDGNGTLIFQSNNPMTNTFSGDLKR